MWADDPPIVCSRYILEMVMSVSWFNGEREEVKEVVQQPNLSWQKNKKSKVIERRLGITQLEWIILHLERYIDYAKY